MPARSGRNGDFMNDTSALSSLASGLLSGAVKVVDITAPLGPDTPVLYLPPQFGKNTPNVKVHTISQYDQNGPFWAWNWIELGEHTDTQPEAQFLLLALIDFGDYKFEIHYPPGAYRCAAINENCARQPIFQA